jgi:glycosyltransferase involved in cell wall biosynthesis
VVAPLVSPLTEAQLGGAQAFVTDLALELSRRGHAVTLHCAEGSDVRGVELVPVPTGDLAAAMVRPAGGTVATLPEMREAVRRAYAGVVDRAPDAVTQHAFDAEAIEEAETLPCRVIHTLHLPPLSPAIVAAARGTRRPLIAVSEAGAAGWRAAGISTRVIRNGVPDFDPKRSPVQPWAMVAGRVSPEKQTHVAVALARLAGLVPVVVGPIYDAAYARQQGLAVQPPLPRPQLWRLMARCAVTLMPVNWEEPFGLVAAESQVAGTPVVAYRRGGLPEVIDDGVGGVLVPPGDEDAFVMGIDRARRLDRDAVRASARSRLLIGNTAAAYEAALA